MNHFWYVDDERSPQKREKMAQQLLKASEANFNRFSVELTKKASKKIKINYKVKQVYFDDGSFCCYTDSLDRCTQ